MEARSRWFGSGEWVVMLAAASQQDELQRSDRLLVLVQCSSTNACQLCEREWAFLGARRVKKREAEQRSPSWI